MKFLHTSDWHLGASERTRSLLEDQECFINEICSIIQQERVDAVLLAGDVYDRSVSSAEAIKLYDYAVTKICGELKVPIVAIAGNHDSAERLSVCSDLLAAVGLHVQGALESTVKKVTFPDAEVFMLPWITEEKVKSIYPEQKEEVNTLTDAYRVVTDKMRDSFSPGKRHILVAHAFITDAETSDSDRAAVIGSATQVPASVFEGFDYVALGHIHKPQQVNEHVRYCGTPMAYSFGKEETQDKGVTILDTDDMSVKHVSLHPLHKRVTLTGTMGELLAHNFPDDVVNGYVRLVVTDMYAGLEVVSELSEIYSNYLEVYGKSFDGEGTGSAMTMEEFTELETNPIEIFRHFCRETMNVEADNHLVKLFTDAVEEVKA